MLGTIVNTALIAAGTITGSLLHKGIPEKTKAILMDVIGLAACGVGINAVVQNMPQSQFPVLFIISLAIGTIAGNCWELDGIFQKTVQKFGSTKLGEGLSTAILLYCIGTLSILGPVQSALYHDNTFLFTNATLDLFTSMILATTYGIGIIWAGAVLLLWQGAIYVLAGCFGNFLEGALMTEISIVGGFLIACSGLNVLEIKKFKTINMLPALLIPVAWFLLKKAFSVFM